MMLPLRSLCLQVAAPFLYLPRDMEWLGMTSASCSPCVRPFSNYGRRS
jgi:hypothetical protein